MEIRCIADYKTNTQQKFKHIKTQRINVVHPTNLGYVHTTKASTILLFKQEITSILTHTTPSYLYDYLFYSKENLTASHIKFRMH